MWRSLVVAALCLSFVGCQKMNTGGRLKPFSPSPFFPDGALARHPVFGTIPTSQAVAAEVGEPYLKGTEHGAPVKEIPVEVTAELLDRGKQRYEINCVPCHSSLGDGQGMIVKRGFSSPPSYHEDRLRKAPAGHFFDVITHGYGAMYSYADRVSIDDRWAITAYIRALQKSQHAEVTELTPELRRRLDKLGSRPGGKE